MRTWRQKFGCRSFGLDSFEGGEREFRGWLFTIARRRVLDSARRRCRQPATTVLDGIDVPVPGHANEALWADADVEAALALLRQLRPDQAEVGRCGSLPA